MRKLIALVLSLTFVWALAACGEKNEPWTWTQELKANDISTVTPWNNDGEVAALSASETDELILLLNDLKQNDFIENKDISGGTPSYGIQITTATGTYYINEAIAPAGALELQYSERLWWIDNDTLSSFIKEKAGR